MKTDTTHENGLNESAPSTETQGTTETISAQPVRKKHRRRRLAAW